MPVRQFPGEVTQLPQGAAETERNNPLGARVIGWLLPGASSSGRSVSNIGAVDVGAGPFGCHIKSNNARMQSDALGAALAFPFTVVVVANRVTRTANANDLAGLGHTGGDQLLSFRARTTADNQFLFRLTNGGGVTSRSFSANVAGGGGAPAVLSATVKSASDVDLYWNGRLDNGTLTTGASGTPTYNTIALGGIDRATDSFADTGNDIAYIGVFAGAFSPDEHASIAANPAQVFSDDVWEVVAGSGTTTVTADLSATYTITGTASADASAAYGIRGAVQADASAAYNLRGAVQADASAAYAIGGAVTASLDATYEILSADSVSADLPAAYVIQGIVQADASAAYALRGAVQSDGAGAYNIRTAAQADLSAVYDVEASTGITYTRAPRGGGYPATVQTTERYGTTNTKRPAMTNTRR